MQRSGIDTIKYLTQDTNGKVTNSQLDTKNESQEVSPILAGDHKEHINRRAQRHSKHKTEKNIKDPQKKTGPDPLENHKVAKPAFNVGPLSPRPPKRHLMAFRWRADDGRRLVVFGSSLPSSTK